jgi:hypothetical protein
LWRALLLFGSSPRHHSSRPSKPTRRTALC